MNTKDSNYGVLQQCEDIPVAFPPQQRQHGQPGIEYVMTALKSQVRRYTVNGGEMVTS